MSRLDLVVFGATGFTGKNAVFHLVRLAQKQQLTWSIAGRSEKKLQDVLLEASQRTGEDLSHIKVIVAEVTDEESLNRMCSQCKVVVNCCGPYRLYGEPVVRAAVHSKTHYVDVCGEPQFMESMQLVYDEPARNAGVFVVSACGWDSVPADMGVVYLQDNFQGTLNSVESYVQTTIPKQYRAEARARGTVNVGTWDSLIHGLVHMQELPPLQKKLFPEPLPTFKPKLTRKLLHAHGPGWCVPFPGADESVVYRTQRHLYQSESRRPAQLKAYFRSGGLLLSALLMVASVFFYVMSRFKFTAKLLLDHPRLFSMGVVTRDGPSDEVMNAITFEFELVGRGWTKEEDVGVTEPDKTAVVKVSGSNPGYGATVVSLLQCALTILREQDSMPATKGVMTTGIAFRKTNLIKNLTENGVKFQLVQDK